MRFHLLAALLLSWSGFALWAQPPEPTTPPERPQAEPSDQPPAEPQVEPDDKSDESSADEPVSEPAEIVLRDFLVIPRIGVYGRVPLHRDPVDTLVASGNWQTPEDGQSLDAASGGSRRWRKSSANGQGVLETEAAIGGYAVATVESPTERVMLLSGSGYASVLVNGQPHAGDSYATGWVAVPVTLRKGSNEFVFQVSRPTLRAKLNAPESELQIDVSQATLPDVVGGVDRKVWLGLVLTNATNQPRRGLRLRSSVGDETHETKIAYLDSLVVEQVALAVAVPVTNSLSELTVQVELVDEGDKPLAELTLVLPGVAAGDLQQRTFRSAIDGSVQTYTLVPATDTKAGERGRLVVSEGDSPPAVMLALHDLGTSAAEFAQQLKPSPDWHIVVPTGRTPFGFDWEDWSARDIDEALTAAAAVTGADVSRVVAMGHGSGGHGVLHWGAANPQRLAAAVLLNPWPSLWTYGGGRPGAGQSSAVEQMLTRPTLASDTLALASNLAAVPLRIFHSADNAVVPIDQSRQLLGALASQHKDFAFIEMPGDDHSWQSLDTAQGAFDSFFRSHLQQPAGEIDMVSFATADLAQASRRNWVTILQQIEPRKLSTIAVSVKENPSAISGTTENVARIELDVSMLPEGRPFYVQLDRSRPALFRQVPASKTVQLSREADGRWVPASANPALKSPTRPSGLKGVFANQPLLVYGTGGSPEQQAWAKAKAHYDAQSFLYRGNGRLQVVPDTELPKLDSKDRNIVLYGNADTNRAWPAMLSTSDVQVRGDGLVVNTRPEQGDDLAVLMVRPRPGSDKAQVAVIGGTGLAGMRLTNRLRYFTAGIDYPDLLVFGPQTLADGTNDVRIAGYFDGEWKLDKADFAWRDLAF
jgi:predicted esterase